GPCARALGAAGAGRLVAGLGAAAGRSGPVGCHEPPRRWRPLGGAEGTQVPPGARCRAEGWRSGPPADPPSRLSATLVRVWIRDSNGPAKPGLRATLDLL